MIDTSIFIAGAGGHGRVVAGILREMNVSIAGVFDDGLAVGATWGNSKVVGGFSEIKNFPGRPIFVALGDNFLRKLVSTKLCSLSPSLAHSRSYVSQTAVVGEGTVICAGAIVIEGVSMGRHCIINTSSSVDHDCQLGDFVHVACGATLAGGVVVEEGAFIGAGATVLPQIRIGAWSVVGGGATVIKDVPAGRTVVGTPAAWLQSGEAEV